MFSCLCLGDLPRGECVDTSQIKSHHERRDEARIIIINLYSCTFIYISVLVLEYYIHTLFILSVLWLCRVIGGELGRRSVRRVGVCYVYTAKGAMQGASKFSTVVQLHPYTSWIHGFFFSSDMRL